LGGIDIRNWQRTGFCGRRKTVATKKIWFGMLVMALTFGLVLAGCDNGNDNGSGNGGTLTITGLGTHNGKYVVAVDTENFSKGSGIYRLIAAASSMTSQSSVIGVKISNGQAVLKVYNYQGGGDPTLAYTGSDQNVSFHVYVKDSNPISLKNGGEDGTKIGSVTVNFSSGSGTVALP
jgi:hypothetical protein